jgi:long-chain acyl-CoA synthetase
MTTIIDYLEEHKQNSPKKIFIQIDSQNWTFEDVYNKVNKISLILNQFPKNSIISIMFDNSIEFIISYLGIIKSGKIVHVISPSISKNNFLKQIKSCNPKIILTLKKFINEFENSENKIKLIDFYEFENSEISNKKSEISDISSLIYTSGTTSSPKGVPIKHENILFTTKNIVNVLKYNNSDIDVIPLSLSHSFGLGCLHTSLFVGSTLILHKNTMNILEILNSIKKNNASTFAAVPATLTLLVNNFPEKFVEKCSSLRLIITNSTKVPKYTINKILNLLPNTKFATYYGLTEASRSTFMIFNENKNKKESVGKHAPNVELKIAKENSKLKEGEILVRGKNVIDNYWNSEFGEKFRNDWLETGDLGYLDKEGFLYLTGRKDYVINVGGEKVNPEEIEKIAKTLDPIEEVVAIGIEHEIFGKVIKLLVKKYENKEIDESSIITYCKQNLERFKVPMKVEFVSNFPKNEHGKIIRFMLQEKNNGNNKNDS